MLKSIKAQYEEGNDTVFGSVIKLSDAEEMHRLLLAAQRYIIFCGINQTEKGNPHQQQKLLDEVEDLRNRVER